MLLLVVLFAVNDVHSFEFKLPEMNEQNYQQVLRDLVAQPFNSCDDAPDFSYVPSEISCSLYYQCFDGFETPLTCPPGLEFSVQLQGCTSPELAECDIADDPDAVGVCDNQPNFSYVARNGTCTLYYACVNGSPFLLSCPSGLFFDVGQQTCVLPELSSCVPPATPPPPTQPPPPTPENICLGVGNFLYVRDPFTCNLYYQCISEVAYLLSCPRGYYFDVGRQTCDYNLNVNCQITTTDLPTPPTVDPSNVCTGVLDFNFVGSNTFCDRYYECIAGEPIKHNCHIGMFFNSATGLCVDADTLPCDLEIEHPF